jgi:uncharacterized protein
MSLVLQQAPGGLRLDELTDSFARLGQQIITTGFALSPRELIAPWPSVGTTNNDDLTRLLQWQPELIIWGTGSVFKLPDQVIAGFFLSRKIGFEAMSNGAAARTFHVLNSEFRNAVLAIPSFTG